MRDVTQGNVGQDVEYRGPDRRQGGAGIVARADDQIPGAGTDLGHRQIHLGLSALLEAPLPHVCDHADNGAIGSRDDYGSADRVLTWKECLCGRIADDRDVGASFAIGRLE